MAEQLKYSDLKLAISRVSEVLTKSGSLKIHEDHLKQLYALELAAFNKKEMVNVDLAPATSSVTNVKHLEASKGLEREVFYDPATDTGYLGEFPVSEFFTGLELSDEVGLIAGTVINNDVNWLGFYIGPNASCNKEGGKAYTLYVPQRPLRYDLSWDDINAAGIARGDVKTLTKNRHTYKVRLISGGNITPEHASYDNVEDYGHPSRSEWNQLIYRVHRDTPDGTEFLSGGPQVGDNWAHFTDAELGVNHIESPNGNSSWCMEVWFDNSSYRVTRGYYSVAHVFANTSSNVNTNYGWRPVLIEFL